MAVNSIGHNTILVAVTGAQGVGKSTFCERLVIELKKRNIQDVHFMGGLRQRMEAMGVLLGSASTADTIPAVFSSHLERELEGKSGVLVLDRCVVDALAYTRCLGLNDPLEIRLYEVLTKITAQSLSLIVHLELSPFFLSRGGNHETPELRLRVAEEVGSILSDLNQPTLTLDASSDDAISIAADSILSHFRR